MRSVKEFHLITLQLLIMHGSEDKAAKPNGSQFFHETAGSKDKTQMLYDGAFHDLLSDFGKEAVLADIVNWIDARLATKSVASDRKKWAGGLRKPSAANRSGERG